ncbi:hypothetical protein MHYP_G00060760 [Metynnis hypsauchen]
MGNVRSLGNKMDELTALASSQREYRECMCFSETWLHQDIPDDNVSIDGFQTIRANRGCIESAAALAGCFMSVGSLNHSTALSRALQRSLWRQPAGV